MTYTITSVIVDDEPDAREGLEMLIKNYLPDVKVLDKAANAEEAIRKVLLHKPDLIFLDIKMPGKDGFYVAEELEKLGVETTIIFVTAYDQYAISAIKHAAFDFILKPVDPDELTKAIVRFKNIREKESLKEKLEKLTFFLQGSQLKFSTRQGFIMINPDEIIYGRADGNYTNIYLTKNRKEIITQQIGQIEKQLDHQLFIRVNRSHIINVRFINAFNRKNKIIELSGEDSPDIEVSQTGLKKLMKL